MTQEKLTSEEKAAVEKNIVDFFNDIPTMSKERFYNVIDQLNVDDINIKRCADILKDEWKKHHVIKSALERTNRNVSKAARELGITRMVLRYRIKKYNL